VLGFRAREMNNNNNTELLIVNFIMRIFDVHGSVHLVNCKCSIKGPTRRTFCIFYSSLFFSATVGAPEDECSSFRNV
jgi:hypothetical protein